MDYFRTTTTTESTKDLDTKQSLLDMGQELLHNGIENFGNLADKAKEAADKLKKDINNMVKEKLEQLLKKNNQDLEIAQGQLSQINKKLAEFKENSKNYEREQLIKETVKSYEEFSKDIKTRVEKLQKDQTELRNKQEDLKI